MANLFDFGKAYGFGMEAELPEEELTPVESEDVAEVDEAPVESSDDMNTQELQEEIPQVINTDDVTNVIDDLGDTFEEGNDERPVGDIDYIPEDLKSEIDAIEVMADQHAQVGEDLLLPEEDPYHETPGGMSLTEDAPVAGMDEVEEYAKSVNEINVTGGSGDVDQFMRDEYNEDSYGEDSITGPAPNESVVETPEDAEPLGGGTGSETELQSEPTGNDEDVEVSVSDLDGEEEGEDDALPDAKDVLGTESEDFEEEEEAEDEEPEEDESVDVDSDDTDEDSSDVDEAEEEVEESDDVEVEEDGEEDVEISMEDDGESVLAEEHAIVDSLDVELNLDSSILTEEKQEEAEQAAEETEVEIANVALDEVSEMAPVNSVTGETEAPMEDGSNEQENVTIDDDTMMSDVVGEMVAEDSHGDEDSFYEGDFSVTSEPEDLDQISEGDASYDEGAGEPVDGGDEDYEEVSDEEAEDIVEEDAVEDDIDGDGEAVDTPEEADATIEEEVEESDDEEEEEEYVPEDEE